MLEEASEPDFFKQHEDLDSQQNEIIPTEEKAFFTSSTVPNDNADKSVSEAPSDCLGPSPSLNLFDPISNVQSERKPTIGCRIAQSRRPGGVSLYIYDESKQLQNCIIIFGTFFIYCSWGKKLEA